MMSFREYSEITEHELGVLELDESQLGRKGWVKTVGIALQLRINNLSGRVKSTNDTNQKLDRLSDLIRTQSYLSTLILSADLNDKSLLKGSKRR
jgi:hypothetical protein